MFRKPIILVVLLFVCVLHHSFVINEAFAAQPQGIKSQSIKPMTIKLPDLLIRQYKFVPSDDKGLRVQVANYGQKASQSCRLQLTIRKINGTPVSREKYQTIPVIQPGKTAWIALDTTSILPKNVSLRDTTFKLIADATKIVPESDENNNETWHNQN
jgi:subtilase family serine protease